MCVLEKVLKQKAAVVSAKDKMGWFLGQKKIFFLLIFLLWKKKKTKINERTIKCFIDLIKLLVSGVPKKQQ